MPLFRQWPVTIRYDSRRRLMRSWKLILVVCCFLGWVFSVSPVLASPPQEQLKSGIEKILNILRDPALKGEEQTETRRQALRDAISSRFSFEKMAQFSLARHWKTISAKQQEDFVTLFGKLLEETYISKIEAYTNEKIEYTGESVSKKKAKIFTEIVTSDVKIPIEYRLFNAGGDNWMVYDMLIEGVSMVKNYRSQFDQILQKNSFDDLMVELQKKIGS